MLYNRALGGGRDVMAKAQYGDWFTRACQIALGICVAWGLGFFIAVLAICEPARAQWEFMMLLPGGGGHCGDQIQLFKGLISTNIITDVIIVFLPCWSKSCHPHLP